MILSVISETAPRPLSRFQHQATPDRILMHVAQLVALLAPRFFFSSRRRHTRSLRDWSSDVCSSDLVAVPARGGHPRGKVEKSAPGASHFDRVAGIVPGGQRDGGHAGVGEKAEAAGDRKSVV